jgi:hypothetical protein
VEVVPVGAGCALALAETVVGGTAFAVDRADRRSHWPAVGIHGQAGALQQRHTGDAILGERHAACQYTPVAVNDDQSCAIRPAFLRTYTAMHCQKQQAEQQETAKS